MYRTLLILIMAAFPMLLLAQHGSERYDHSQRTTRSDHTKVDAALHTAGQVEKYLLQQYISLQDPAVAIKLMYFRESPYGRHYQFQQFYHVYPIFNASIKVNTDLQGNISSVFDNLFETKSWSNFPLYSELSRLNMTAAVAGIAEIAQTRNSGQADLQKIIVVDVKDNIPVAAVKANILGPTNGLKKIYLVGAKGEVFVEKNMIKYANPIDTTATAYVFHPDPLTSAEEQYGGLYKDFNDTDVPVLNDERVLKTIRVTLDNGIYKLENPYVRIRDINAPAIAPVTSTTPEFHFTRSESGFEDVMVLYHITEFQEYMQELGFSLVQYQLEADPHGLNGLDQSQFISTTDSSGYLVFGEGGVDDAEDADVIIHEYGHAVIASAAPGSNFGKERNALDEGLGDYFAASYSRKIKEFEWYKVFNWDGHNEFWPGRIANSTEIYPYPSGANIYQAGEVWSSALMEAWEALGGEVMDKIVLASLYDYADNMTMPDAAQLLINADFKITGGANYEELYFILLKRGLLGELKTSIAGSKTFLENKGDILIFLANDVSSANVVVYDIQGRQIYSRQQVTDHIFNIPKSIFPASGMYFISLDTGKQNLVEKVIHIEH